MGVSRQRWRATRDSWRTKLWPLPALGVVAAVALGVALPQLDEGAARHLPGALGRYLFSGGPEAARSVLSVLAGSLITVTALTFSLTVVTLQLAASQFSPRLLRTFTRDRFVQVTLALLLATFTYAVTVLRTVRTATADQPAFVPQLSVTVAFLLGLASVVTLVAFLAHLVGQIRIEPVLGRVSREASAAVRRVLEPVGDRQAPPPVPPGSHLLPARSSGFVTVLDEQALTAAAAEADAVVYLAGAVGDWLVQDTPVAHVWPRPVGATLDPGALDLLAGRVSGALSTGPERTGTQDVSFGLRQLVDVTVKALSPGINDPTTAVHALGHAAVLLCELCRYQAGPRLLRDEAGQGRAIVSGPDFAALLELAVSQPRRYGAAEPDVLARLLTLLREVAWSTNTAAQRAAVSAELGQMLDTIARQEQYTTAERTRLEHLADQVRAALVRRWPPDQDLDAQPAPAPAPAPETERTDTPRP